MEGNVTDSTPQPADKYVNRRLMKLGGSLVVGVPYEVVERWSLDKGDEVRITVLEEGIKIEPKEPTRTEIFSPEKIEAYSKAVSGIQSSVTLIRENEIKLKFSGDDKEAVRLFVRKLWQNLPLMLQLMGLGSVEELPHREAKERKEEV
jgi:antitoxin component of MazEF toxin-antitoxin module